MIQPLVPGVAKAAATFAFIARCLTIMDPKSVKLVFRNETAERANLIFENIFYDKTIKTWQLFNLDEKSAFQHLDDTSPKGMLVIYVLRSPTDYAATNRLVYLNASRNVRHLLVLGYRMIKNGNWRHTRHGSQCLIVASHPNDGTFSLHMWDWHNLFDVSETLMWTSPYTRYTLYRNVSMSHTEVPAMFSTLLVQLTPWPPQSYVVNSIFPSSGRRVAGFQTEIAKLVEDAMKPLDPIEFTLPADHWRNISWPWTPYYSDDTMENSYIILKDSQLQNRVKNNYFKRNRHPNSTPIFLVFAEQHNGFHSLPYASDTYMAIVPHNLVQCKRQYSTLILNFMWACLAGILAAIRKIVQRIGVPTNYKPSSFVTLFYDSYGRFYGVPVRFNIATNHADNFLVGSMTVCGMLATMVLTNSILNQFLDDEICQKYQRIEDLRDGQLEVRVGHGFPENTYNKYTFCICVKIKQNKNVLFKIFKGL